MCTFNSADSAHGRDEPAAKILLVEDDADQRSFGKFFLGQHGFEVELAETSRRALLALVSGVDLVLMDLRLPDKSGGFTAREMRSRGFTGAIIAFTCDQPDVQELKNAGFDGFVSKLAPLSEIIATCRQHVSHRKGLNDDHLPDDSRRFASMRRRFCEKLLMVAAEMRCHWTISDLTSLQAASHRLSGSCSLYGYDELGLVAKELNRVCNDGYDKAQVEALLAHFEQKALEANPVVESEPNDS